MEEDEEKRKEPEIKNIHVQELADDFSERKVVAPTSLSKQS